ncbi:LacI family DNA-binding transcriptional regulator [Pararhodobacter sp. CCB-MM2]|uniref:LacI family DNA-binding transcriptional regulator n=1 Tax=Pararhodobacter sp. CCB-MM2 TaxID=1786003 RepID=UPI00083743FF|nr:LacI family DNA-binding transcriptional regulator [Pararhodobacter sp. CCB-MM2]
MSEPTGKPGLRDVAREAGVSLATASRAMSQPDLVSEAVRARIAEASDRLGYVANRTARRLSQHRSETIGVIVPSIGNPLFAPALDGVRSVLDAQEYGMLIASAERDPARELKQIRTMIEHGVDAVLTLMPEHDPALFPFVARTGTPVVYVTSTAPEAPVPLVDFDNPAAMTEIVRHVIAQGHRRIGVLTGSRESTPVIGQRLDAALAELTRAGLTPPADWVVEADYASDEARAGARRLLTCTERPTAIVCTGDQHAVATVIEAQALGIDVPGALSVTGCNDVSIARLCNPQLTTLHIPYRLLGEQACRHALSLLSGESVPDRTVLDHRLVVRDSVAAPKEGPSL